MKEFNWYDYQEIKAEQETEDDDVLEMRQGEEAVWKILRPVLGVRECELRK